MGWALAYSTGLAGKALQVPDVGSGEADYRIIRGQFDLIRITRPGFHTFGINTSTR